MGKQADFMEKILESGGKRGDTVRKVADLLSVSVDSVYRRMREETDLSLEEAFLLSSEFKVSLGEPALDGASLNCKRGKMVRSVEGFESLMERFVQQFRDMRQDSEHHLYYLAANIPPFYTFSFPELGAFQLYVWMRSMYGIDGRSDEVFSMDRVPDCLRKLSQMAWEEYRNMRVTEFWNAGTVGHILEQIGYYFDAGLLPDKKEALGLCDQVQETLRMIQKQAIAGRRMSGPNLDLPTTTPYRMYWNEILQMKDQILAQPQENAILMIPYAGLNYLATADAAICEDVSRYVDHMARRSYLMEEMPERERNRFFLRIKKQIDDLRSRIEETDPFL